MANLDGSNRGVLVSIDSLRRIGRAVSRVANVRRDRKGHKFKVGYDDGDGGLIRLGKTTEAWDKGTLADITLWESGTPPAETASSDAEVLEDCVNKMADIEENAWVILARSPNDYWYVIAAECDPADPEEGS